SRRPRSSTEQTLWGVHLVSAAEAGDGRVGSVSYETDRARFIGRGRSTRDPVVVDASGPLSGTTGAVLDPIFAIRVRVRLEQGQYTSVSFTTLVAPTRERAFELADRYHDPHTAQRALDLAWTGAQVELRELGMSPSDAALYQGLAGPLVLAKSGLRAAGGVLVRNRGSQHQPRAGGIPGDWPVLLATIHSPEGPPTAREILVAHHY